MAGLYLHVPFCKQACSYCDFYFVTQKALIPAYLEGLKREMISWKDTRWAALPFETLYLGGGTPSLLSLSQLEEVLRLLNECFNVSSLKECTVEVNPDDVGPEYLAGLKSLGVDRLSIGIQSFDESLLAFMHRSHSGHQAAQCLEWIQHAGFKRFSVDLIYGNPHQTIAMLDDDLTRLLAFAPPHVSAYALTIEEGTRLGTQVQRGRVQIADEDAVAEHIRHLQERLLQAGLHRYEVSNFAVPGAEAVHNAAYWDHRSYLGLGPGAHSFWHEAGEAWRWHNERDLRLWLKDPEQARAKPENLRREQRAEEYLLLRLRTKKGLDLVQLEQAYQVVPNADQHAYWQQLVKMGLAQSGTTWSLTSEGFQLADRITLDLLSKSGNWEG